MKQIAAAAPRRIASSWMSAPIAAGDSRRAPALSDGGVGEAVDDDRRVAADEATRLVPDEDVAVPDEDSVERATQDPARRRAREAPNACAEQLAGERARLVRHVFLGQQLVPDVAHAG